MIVTTTTEPLPWQIDRARAVAVRCGLPCVARRGPIAAPAAYLVGRHRDELWSPSARLFVHAGMLRSRLADGDRHPLLRAVGPVRSVVDGTLGLAQDALHLAAAGTSVLGIEASPIVASLLEEGLARLARSPDPEGRAAAIRLAMGSCADVLAGEPADSHDAVVLDPMFEEPAHAAPGYALFREVAVHAPIDDDTVAQALRVAPRLVVKVPTGAPSPVAGAVRVAGRAVDWWVAVR